MIKTPALCSGTSGEEQGSIKQRSFVFKNSNMVNRLLKDNHGIIDSWFINWTRWHESCLARPGRSQDSETRLVYGVNQTPTLLLMPRDQAQVEARPGPALTLPWTSHFFRGEHRELPLLAQEDFSIPFFFSFFDGAFGAACWSGWPLDVLVSTSLDMARRQTANSSTSRHLVTPGAPWWRGLKRT